MDQRNKSTSTSHSGKHREGASSMSLQNGSDLLKAFLAETNGSHDIPLRIFSSDDIVKATNNFSNVIDGAEMTSLSRGYFQERDISVRRFNKLITFRARTLNSDTVYDIHSAAIQDIVTTSRMSLHKNVLRISGCFLESEYAALVYEYAGNRRLKDALFDEAEPCLSWSSRLKIASEVASVITYLHTMFDTPIIFRTLNPDNIIIDQDGVAKLFGFSWSISLPPGKLQVKDDVIGVTGYLDVEYIFTGLVTQKVDVYSFGVLLLVLLAGKEPICRDNNADIIHITDYVNNFIHKNEFMGIVDSQIRPEIGSKEQEEQLQAFLNLALVCVHDKGNCRPDMIDVAKKSNGSEGSSAEPKSLHLPSLDAL